MWDNQRREGSRFLTGKDGGRKAGKFLDNDYNDYEDGKTGEAGKF
jgi:hypothetical protein